MLTESPLTFIRQQLAGLYSPGEIRSLTRLLIEDGLGMQMLDFYTGKVSELSEDKETILREMLQRLTHNEPIQYVVGKTEFADMMFHTAPGVLIPRPETEELVDWICQAEHPSSILDAGTGSGCIAIALSKHFKEAEVEAWDISSDALKIAEENNRLNNTTVKFTQQDILSPRLTESDRHRYNLIVSNPPYITEKERCTMEKNVLDWEPETALFVPDNDPLLFYRAIARLGKELLKNDGRIYFEINWLFANDMRKMLKSEGYTKITIRQDLFEKDRMLSAILHH